MSFNLTGELDTENYFIQCANSDMLIDNCSISALTHSVSEYTADYIKTLGNLTISHSDITVDLRYKMDCISFAAERNDGKKLLIDGCIIKMYNCVNGAYGVCPHSPGNLYIMRYGGVISKCRIVCEGAESGGSEYLSCTARMSADILNCEINLTNRH